MRPQGVRPTVVRSPGAVSATVVPRRVAVEAPAALCTLNMVVVSLVDQHGPPACYHAAMRPDLPQQKTCCDCSATFSPSSRHKRCTPCRKVAYKTPCPACGHLISRGAKSCQRCRSSQRGEGNPNWRGGTTRAQSGYVFIKDMATGKYKAEHVLVMQRMISRPLLAGETVHHLNGVRDDNRPENLELWCKPQPAGVRARDALAWARTIISRYEPIEDQLVGGRSESRTPPPNLAGVGRPTAVSPTVRSASSYGVGQVPPVASG